MAQGTPPVSGANRWPSIDPWARLLQLSCEPEEGGFVPEAADEVSANGQAAGVPVQRHRHPRQPGHIADGRERNEGEYLVDAQVAVLLQGTIEGAQRNRRLRQSRREPDVA